MFVAKQVADLLTFGRAMLFVVFAWLGLTYGAQGLPMATWMLLGSWASDALDGPIARRSRLQYHTWLGDHDLQVDMAACTGLLIYMMACGFIDYRLSAIYLLVWGLAFYRWGVHRSPGMLFQAPIYGWFIWTALQQAPAQGLLIVAYIVGLIILTWPRFPREVVPGFLTGMRAIKKK